MDKDAEKLKDLLWKERDELLKENEELKKRLKLADSLIEAIKSEAYEIHCEDINSDAHAIYCADIGSEVCQIYCDDVDVDKKKSLGLMQEIFIKMEEKSE